MEGQVRVRSQVLPLGPTGQLHGGHRGADQRQEGPAAAGEDIGGD